MKLASTVGRLLANPAQYSPDEFIQAAEITVKTHPTEWPIFYTLGQKYLEVGYFARALHACKRCVELKPDDIRSAYALATIYNTLTTADLASRRDEFLAIAATIQPPKETGPYDPSIALDEMTELGMVVDTAAAQAIRWFERSLVLRPDARSKAQIQWDLETLFRRFPHLRQ